ncbi:30S ribosomal protein 2, chloroplastic [Dionaea muscipula]
MASISVSSILSSSPSFQSSKTLISPHSSCSTSLHLPRLKPPCHHFCNPHLLKFAVTSVEKSRLRAVAQALASAAENVSVRKLYVGNIPRTVNNDELRRMVEEHGAVEKAEVMYDKYSGRSRRFGFVTMKTADDAIAAIEKLNGTEIGGRKIIVNITEKPLEPVDLSILQGDDFQFVDSPHKVYVGNLAKNVTSDTLKRFFSGKGKKVLSAKVSRVPGTSKSRGFGFVTFSSAEEVEAAVSSFNNADLEGQQIRVNKA